MSSEQRKVDENKENVAPIVLEPTRRVPKSYWGQVMSANYAAANFLNPETRKPLQDLQPWPKKQDKKKSAIADKLKKPEDIKHKAETEKHVKKAENSSKTSETRRSSKDTKTDATKAGTSKNNSDAWKWDSFSFDSSFP